MTYRWLRVPMLGAAALTMMLATTGAAQASPREGGDYGRYDRAYGGYGDGYYGHRVVYRGGRRVVVRVVYVHPRHHRYYRYDRGRYYRYHRYHRYHDRW